MANKSKLPVQKTIRNKTTFSYQKGACALDFTLVTEVKTELKNFLDILKAAQEDIQKHISEL